MPVDALAHCAVRATTAMILAMWNKRIPIFQTQGFTGISVLRNDGECKNIFVLLKLIQRLKGKIHAMSSTCFNSLFQDRYHRGLTFWSYQCTRKLSVEWSRRLLSLWRVKSTLEMSCDCEKLYWEMLICLLHNYAWNSIIDRACVCMLESFCCFGKQNCANVIHFDIKPMKLFVDIGDHERCSKRIETWKKGRHFANILHAFALNKTFEFKVRLHWNIFRV